MGWNSNRLRHVMRVAGKSGLWAAFSDFALKFEQSLFCVLSTFEHLWVSKLCIKFQLIILIRFQLTPLRHKLCLLLVLVTLSFWTNFNSAISCLIGPWCLKLSFGCFKSCSFGRLVHWNSTVHRPNTITNNGFFWLSILLSYEEHHDCNDGNYRDIWVGAFAIWQRSWCSGWSNTQCWVRRSTWINKN